MKQKITDRLIDYSRIKFKVRKSMRYDDVGDYFDNSIISYDIKNPIIRNAIMLHEFIEYTLIKSAGISVSMIDKFDTDEVACEKYQKEYKFYTKYHRIANNVERHFIENMGMDWKNYQKAIYSEKINVKPSKKGKAATRNKRTKLR